ncbi:BTAD domain-containing putative transcriptional regulator [Frankia sp. R82]|uniref:BTAD domain-containing putative transcriptional regulator n=1 Tax=Frankia sp. R82 TaxID=2950553 RepID=UPI002043CEE0|nr:BTAD domain-containing putative transcriptional regulator [Frankia sp. R82]MCM3883137.1 LysM peptidoglycan-binding domain-containing protein [Frankia sp. R82]
MREPSARPRRRRLATAGQMLGRLVGALVALVALIALVGGLPWGLWHFIGWPLPHHVPSWSEISARLTGPMDDSLLLDILATLLWPLWAAFALSVAAAVPDVVREARWPSHGPLLPSGGLRGLATFLLGTVLLVALHSRSTLTLTAGPPAAPATATAPAAPQLITVARLDTGGTTLPAAAPGTVVVQLPHGGVYDSLWRIADRALGDGARWPQIWALNHGVTQADGRALTQPALIRPGWVLHLPAQPTLTAPSTGQAPSHPTTSPPPATASPPEPGRAASPAPTTSPPGIPSTPPSADSRPSARPTTPTGVRPTSPATPPTPPAAPAPAQPPGIHLPSGAYLGVGTVALLMVAVFSARLWRRRQYVPGSGVRDDLDEGPVIRQLAVAYDAATAQSDDVGDSVVVRPPGDPHVTGRRHAAATAATHAAPPGRRHVGTSPDGQPLALDLAAAHGLGLIGPGADDAIRALLLALLADRHQPDTAPVEILIPVTDARRLLGEEAAADPPQRLHIVADLSTLLNRAEADVLTRARLATAGEDTGRSALVLIAAPDQTSARRLQAVLDNGSPFNVLGILYGQWRPGATARIRPDGVVGAASPDIAAALVGSRLFTLPAADTAGLLDLLADADAPASNQEAYRQANPTQGPPPPRPTSAPPPASPTPSPAATPPADQPGPDKPPATGWLPPDTSSTPTLGEATSAVPPPADPPVEPQRPPRATTPLLLTLLGRLQLLHRPEPDGDYQTVDGIGTKGRAILAYLAAHPDGTSRTAIIDALWPDDGKPQRQRENRFYAAISQLRRIVAAASGMDVLTQQDGRWQLRHDLLTVDLWQAQAALDAHRQATSTTDQLAALLPLTTLYTGHLTDDLTDAWAETHREHLRRSVADALASTTSTIQDDSPQRLQLLETLRRLDPYNEQLHLDLAHAQTRLGQHHAAAATYHHLITALAEIGERPTSDTQNAFQKLAQSAPPSTQSA